MRVHWACQHSIRLSIKLNQKYLHNLPKHSRSQFLRTKFGVCWFVCLLMLWLAEHDDNKRFMNLLLLWRIEINNFGFHWCCGCCCCCGDSHNDGRNNDGLLCGFNSLELYSWNGRAISKNNGKLQNEMVMMGRQAFRKWIDSVFGINRRSRQLWLTNKARFTSQRQDVDGTQHSAAKSAKSRSRCLD